MKEETIQGILSQGKLEEEIASLLKSSDGRAASMPSGCNGIFNNDPNSPSGFYLAKSPSNRKVDAVYCDFSVGIGRPGKFKF